VISLRAADSALADGTLLTGETTLELDFSALTTVGTYRVCVAGLGCSWSFKVGPAALGGAFYVHARGLYHQRCGTNLTAEHTRWARNDVHHTLKGGHPPEDNDYRDHSADNWGWRNEDGSFAPQKWFDVVAATATEETLPGVAGGWHDAGDFDRRDFHFGVVSDLVNAYLVRSFAKPYPL